MSIDTSIYNALGRGVKTVRDWQVEDEQRQQAAQTNELNALNLGNARATAADNALVRQDQATIRNALSAVKPGATQEEIAGAYEGTRTPTGLTQAQAIRKAMAEAAKLAAQTKASEAAAGASGASQAKTQFEIQQARTQQHLQKLIGVSDVNSAHQWLDEAAASGEIPADRVQAAKDRLAANPASLNEWKTAAVNGGLTIAQQREQEWKAQEFARNQGNDTRNAANQDILIVNGKPVINQPKQQAFVERAKASAAPGGVQPVQYFTDTNTGQVFPLPTKIGPGGPGPINPVLGPDNKPIGGKTKGGGANMSPTLQKELIESDEMVAGAQSVKSALAEALRLNDKAYSGVQALTRAKVRSNLPGQSAEADATIQFDNIIRESALTGMKAIFGGNPTEGERAILLEIQASSEKTPAQRKAILERAMRAADRRAAINAGKAKAIREGSYLTEGAPQQPEEPTQPARNAPSVSNW